MVSILSEYVAPLFSLHVADIGPFDALSICELSSIYNPPSGLPEPEFPDGSLRPRKLIATTPNMPFIPDFNLQWGEARVRLDGRFGLVDFTQWPQLYYEAHPHLPFVLRRPPSHELPTHPLRLIWWNVTDKEHVPECGSIFGGLGKLSSSYATQLKDLELQLTEEVRRYQDDNGGHRGSRLNICANAMRNTVSRLKYASLTFRDLVQNVAAFQRQYLETRAWLDTLQKWGTRLGHAVGDGIPEVDTTIMGCGTYDPSVVQSFFMAGIPVWYIRPPSEVPLNININMVVCPDSARHLICMEDWPDQPFPTLYSSRPSAALLAATTALPPGGFVWRGIEVDSVVPTSTLGPEVGPIRNPPTSNRADPCEY
jgi:hypothetical protein